LVDRGDGPLQQRGTSCSWTMSFAGLSRAALVDRVVSLLAAGSVPIVRERKGRQEHDDLRPSVLALAVSDDRAVVAGRRGDAGCSVGGGAELATQPRGVRPIELVRGLIAVSGGPSFRPLEGQAADGYRSVGIPVLDRACRTQQWIERDGIREEPLQPRGIPAETHRAVHALERAS